MGLLQSKVPPARLPLPSASVAEAVRGWNYASRRPGPSTASELPTASIIIAVHNQFAYTRLCIESLYRNTDPATFELIVIDNGSRDESSEYFRDLAALLPNLTLITNAENRGFAAAVNQGIQAAGGEFIVLLNNDVVASHGWLPGLLSHFRHIENLGMLGPITNSSGNEQKIPARYDGFEEFEAFAAKRREEYAGQSKPIEMLGMYCAVLPKAVVEKVGLLDERFGLGMFEDDDYALRLKAAGYKIAYAQDVYVHHFGSASFNSLDKKTYWRNFDENRKRFEEKWGAKW